MNTGVWLSENQTKYIPSRKLNKVRKYFEVRLQNGRRYFYFHKKKTKLTKNINLFPFLLLDQGYDDFFLSIEGQGDVLVLNGEIINYKYFFDRKIDLLKLSDLNINIISNEEIANLESKLPGVNVLELNDFQEKNRFFLGVLFLCFMLFIGFVLYEN